MTSTSQREKSTIHAAMRDAGYLFSGQRGYSADEDVAALMLDEGTAYRHLDGCLYLSREGWEVGCKMLGIHCVLPAATRTMPLTAIPETLFGEAACRFADDLGIQVSTYALRGERPMTTADARAFLAKGEADGGDYSSAVWLVTSYRIAS